MSRCSLSRLFALAVFAVIDVGVGSSHVNLLLIHILWCCLLTALRASDQSVLHRRFLLSYFVH